ncbi:MAG: MOSC N-terminal beta barrel domain-containing protein [Gammaproteobacteria bacterium]|nr:MOSC N-terminal beta barrel domain-containing protein [Gammaproteobacteria bacterium]
MTSRAATAQTSVMELLEIWRYPVKSMQGEQLEQAHAGPGGIAGDRHWAVIDAKSGVSLSAKRHNDLLHCRAWTSGSSVMIGLPDGREYPAGTIEVAGALSDLLGRQVITQSANETGKIQHEFPSAITEGQGEPFLYEPDTEAFFDCAPLQLLTSATLLQFQQLLPESKIHKARFRPNFLVETSETGFVENNWVGKNVTLGSLPCQVYDDTRRCIMVALSQGMLPRDTDIIRTVLKSNEGRAGIALKTMVHETISRGAIVEVHPD